MRYDCNAINAIRKVRDSVEETKCAALVCIRVGARFA